MRPAEAKGEFKVSVQNGETDGRGKLEGTEYPPLMDNDSPKSQIKARTTASILFKRLQGFRQ